VSGRVDELQQLLAPVVEALGYELWGVELVAHGRHSLLRIFIDSEQGINVEDCATVSRQAGATLDVADPFGGAYTLEVSSPGWDRPLFSEAQFRRYVGERVKVRLAYPLQGRRNCSGRLVAVDAEGLEIEVSAEICLKLPFAAIKKANLAIDGE
jgi:ribosome maturation factor RimP